MNDLFFARFQMGMSLAEVTFILVGWGLAQFPHLVSPDVTIQNARRLSRL
jgi:hypothetical protein